MSSFSLNAVCGGTGDRGCKKKLTLDYKVHLTNPYCRMCYHKAALQPGGRRLHYLFYLIFHLLFFLLFFFLFFFLFCVFSVSSSTSSSSNPSSSSSSFPSVCLFIFLHLPLTPLFVSLPLSLSLSPFSLILPLPPS